MKHQQSKTFPVGGLHPTDYKLSAQEPIKTLPLPQSVIIPVSQHIGAPAKPIVSVGDYVRVGERIAEAQGFISAHIHAPVSGTVRKIDKALDSSGFKRDAIFIDVQGDDWLEDINRTEELIKDTHLNTEEIGKRIADAGIVGLGGATFPSHVKLSVPPGKEKPEFLIVNGAECEPFLTSDHRLMLEAGEEILIGISLLMKVLDVKRALIGIEDNKPDAIDHFKKLSTQYSGVEVHALKTQYPQGGERQLIKALTDREIPPPPAGLPIDAGCVVFNVGTIFTIYEAVMKNKPLIERVVTLTGKDVKSPANFKVRFGTPLTQLIEAIGGAPENTGKILAGGPMMGKALSSFDIPITKGISGILLIAEKEAKRKEIQNCIRCAKCVSACPLGLEPYLLMTLADKQLWEKAEKERMLNCCDCGCCTYICPASRPLLDYMRLGKSTLLQLRKSKQTNG